MAKGMLKNQSHKQKSCVCGRGTIYTGDNAKYNQKVNGVEVCEECYMDNLMSTLVNQYRINQYHNKEQ